MCEGSLLGSCMDNGSGSVPAGPQSPAEVPREATSVNVGVLVEVPLIYPLETIGQVMLRRGARAGLPGPGGARRGGAILPSCSGCPLATVQPGDAQTQLQRGFLHCRVRPGWDAKHELAAGAGHCVGLGHIHGPILWGQWGRAAALLLRPPPAPGRGRGPQDTATDAVPVLSPLTPAP